MADTTWFDAEQREIEEEIEKRVDDDYRDIRPKGMNEATTLPTNEVTQ